MLLFYNLAFEKVLDFAMISIHLMLLFYVLDGHRGEIFCKHFNTSNVTILLVLNVGLEPPIGISIHLMLLFYELTGIDVKKLLEFQYI